MKFPLVLVLLAALLTQTGCVTGRRTFALPVPAGPAAAPTKGAVYISTVTDDRVFENKPSDPSVPSIDGDVTTMPAAEKDRMIGRQRNTWGHAMGDIALADGDTVTGRVRALVEEGLRRKGYTISQDPTAATTVAISVKQFWAWSTPGAFVLTFEAKIGASLTLKEAQGSATIEVRGYGLNHGQVAKDGNWIEAFQPAFDQFLSNLSAELDHATPAPAQP